MQRLPLVSFVLSLTAAVSAQSMSIQVLQPMSATVQVGTGGPQSNNLPAGVVGASGLLANNMLPFALAELSWSSSVESSRMTFRLDMQLSTNSQSAPSSASIAPGEFLVELSNPVAVNVRLELSHLIGVPQGTLMPQARIDVGNDGSDEVTESTLLQTNYVIAQIGPTPLQIRFQVAGNVNGTAAKEVQLMMSCTPSDAYVDEWVYGCFGSSLQLLPTFGGDLDYAWLPAINPLGVAVFGLAPQAVMLPLGSSLPCVLLPRPDLTLIVFPWQMETLSIPAAARPVQLWAQVVEVASTVPLGLGTTTGYSVALH